jgi:hypothetical protein
MGTVSVYCFIGAQNREDAEHAVNVLLEDTLGREFYDGFDIEENGTRPLSDISADYLTEVYTRSQDLIQQFRGEAEAAREADDRWGEAVALRRASDLLFENMCPAMPWYNIESYDFSLPPVKQGWWAVMVNFYC